MDQNIFSIIYLIKTISRWRKLILTATLIALAGSIIITDPHIIKPYYKSVSLFYPYNPNVISSQNLYEQKLESQYGGKDDVDRCLAIANSSNTKMHLVHTFNLFKHYDIDSASTKYPITKVVKELKENVSIEKNEEDAIVVTVYDTNKDTAAAIANEIVRQVDAVNKQVSNANKEKILKIYLDKTKELQAYIDAIADTILTLRNKGGIVNDIGHAGKLKNLSGASEDEYESITERIKVLEEDKRSAVREYTGMLQLYTQYKSTINHDVPTVYVLDYAAPAEQKSKPVRWLITLVSTLLAFVFSLVVVVLIDEFRSIKARL